MFLFSDSQIINETFLEDINNILNAGEVPNLFPNDEVDRVVNDTRCAHRSQRHRGLCGEVVTATFPLACPAL